MAGFRDSDKNHFPLTDQASVISLFEDQLKRPDGPNLAILSITLGYIENVLTLNRTLPIENDLHLLRPMFPVVDLESVEALYLKFESLVKGSVDLSLYPEKWSNRNLVKRLSDVIWGTLSRSFKDKAHIGSLYSLLTGKT